MPITLPNLDRIFKDDVKVGEAFKKLQDFSIQNVTPVAGNAVPNPEPSTPPPASQQTVNPDTGANPRVDPPPRSGVPLPSLE